MEDPNVFDTLARIEAKLDANAVRLDAWQADIAGAVDDHEERLSALERLRYGVPVAAATAVAALAISLRP